MDKKLKIRRIVLFITGVVFLAIAIGSLVAPETMAGPLGIQLNNITAYNEFRAIYVGLWLAHTFIFF